MGCFDSCCSVTGTCISYTTESRVALLIVESVANLRYGLYSNSLYKPRSLFVRGTYNNYGAVVPDKNQDFADEVIQRLFGHSLYHSNIWKIIIDKSRLGKKIFNFILVHEAVLDYIISIAPFEDAPFEEIFQDFQDRQTELGSINYYKKVKEFESNLAKILSKYNLTYGFRGDCLNQVEEILSIEEDLDSGEKIANWCLEPTRLSKIKEIGAFYYFFDNVLSKKVAPATSYLDQHIDLEIEERKIKIQAKLLNVARQILDQQKKYFEDDYP